MDFKVFSLAAVSIYDPRARNLDILGFMGQNKSKALKGITDLMTSIAAVIAGVVYFDFLIVFFFCAGQQTCSFAEVEFYIGGQKQGT